MVYRGHVRNGKIELDQAVSLPEGAEVQVAFPTVAAPDDEEQGPTLYERMKDFIGVVDDLPPDASVNIDHYLYGHPKR